MQCNDVRLEIPESGQCRWVVCVRLHSCAKGIFLKIREGKGEWRASFNVWSFSGTISLSVFPQYCNLLINLSDLLNFNLCLQSKSNVSCHSKSQQNQISLISKYPAPSIAIDDNFNFCELLVAPSPSPYSTPKRERHGASKFHCSTAFEDSTASVFCHQEQTLE